MLEPCILSSACLVSCWSVVFGSRHSCLEFRFRVEVRTLALHVLSCCVSVRSRVRSAVRYPVHMCCFVLHAVHVFIGCMHSCYVLCCVACSLCFSLAACFHVVMSCVNTWLMSILISCVFVSCLHMAGDLFCWPCACVLCEHMAFSVCHCALMSIVLTPPILLPDYWLICPTCVYLVTLLICFLYNLLVFAVLCQFVIACILSCPVCLIVPCHALPSLPAVLFFPYGVVFVACFVLFLINNAHSPALLSPRLIPLPKH